MVKLALFYSNFVVGKFYRHLQFGSSVYFDKKPADFSLPWAISRCGSIKYRKGCAVHLPSIQILFIFLNFQRKNGWQWLPRPTPTCALDISISINSLKTLRQTWPGFTESSPLSNFWHQWALWTKSTQPDFQTITSSRFYSLGRRKQLELIVWNAV